MKLFDNMIRAIEANSRRNERKKLIEELQDIFINREYDDARIRWISERLNVLDGADLSAYLNRNKPLRSVSAMVKDESLYANVRPTMYHDNDFAKHANKVVKDEVVA